MVWTEASDLIHRLLDEWLGEWALYGGILLLSCVLLGVWCACASLCWYIKCCLCPLHALWWVVSTVVALVIKPIVLLIRLLLPK